MFLIPIDAVRMYVNPHGQPVSQLYSRVLPLTMMVMMVM